MADRLVAAPLPPRDPFDLALRFRGIGPNDAAPAPPVAAPLPEGYEQAFWVVDQPAAHAFQVTATLRLATPHTYWFVQSGLDDRAPRDALERSAAAFESVSYPSVHRYFGSEPDPGIDGDTHIVFLLGHVPGVAAYFSGADAFPRAVNPRSNERDMIYVSLDAVRVGERGFDGTLAHEFQHMVQFARCPFQETWVDEGTADLATQVAGFGETPIRQFTARPDVQLTAWTNDSVDLGRHYQAAYLFMRYFADRFGGWDALPDLFSTCARGPALFDRFLDARAVSERFDGVFADWAVANLVDDRAVADGRFGYAEPDVHVSPGTVLDHGGTLQGSLAQYAASYVDLPVGATVSFNGSPNVLPVQAASAGSVWWSNRADSLDSALTRAVDLRGVEHATARFRVWYDVEDRFDFAYLAASRDSGLTWQVLPGQHAVDDRAVGNAFGPGWTGVSGGASTPGWVDESADLSPVAGSQVLLRFEYVTDQGYNARGFAFDRFEVPEIDLRDGDDGGPWTSDGWVRVTGPIPQPWVLRLVEWDRGGSARVSDVAVDVSGQGLLSTDPAAERSVLVIAPTAFRTLEPASYAIRAT